MKKRHLIRMLLIGIACFGVHLSIIFDFFNIIYINNHIENYVITDAVVTDTYFKARDVFVSTLSFEYEGARIEKDFSHDLSDYVGKIEVVAIDKRSGKISRLRIRVDYIHLVCIFVGGLLLLLEHIIYKEEQKRYMARKVKELNSFYEE